MEVGTPPQPRLPPSAAVEAPVSIEAPAAVDLEIMLEQVLDTHIAEGGSDVCEVGSQASTVLANETML